MAPKRIKRPPGAQENRRQIPNRLRSEYQGPRGLELLGPLIKARWRVPQALAAALEASGKPVPAPVDGEMLVDTGASSTCISEAVATQLGLPELRIGKTYGAGGLHSNRVYAAEMEIDVSDGKSGMRMSRPVECMGIPDLDKPLKGVAQNITIIGLLGRDFLRHVTMTYFGPKGVMEMVIDYSTLKMKPHTDT